MDNSEAALHSHKVSPLRNFIYMTDKLTPLQVSFHELYKSNQNSHFYRIPPGRCFWQLQLKSRSSNGGYIKVLRQINKMSKLLKLSYLISI